MNVTASTLVCATLARPNRTSPAPAMHNAGFEALGLDFVYVAFEPDDVEAALDAVRVLGIRGASISKPYKEQALKYVDKVDEISERIGAINTVLNTDGVLEGYNSDWIGAIRALEETTSLTGRTVTLLGAGGAARAVAYGLLERGARPTIFNRTEERGQRLATDLGLEFGGSLRDAGQAAAEVIINATSVGFNAPDEDLPVPDDAFEDSPIVLDAVFNPRQTAFLTRAEQHGCQAVRGTRMLVHQGAFQFELFTGAVAPIADMEAAVERNLT